MFLTWSYYQALLLISVIAISEGAYIYCRGMLPAVLLTGLILARTARAQTTNTLGLAGAEYQSGLDLTPHDSYTNYGSSAARTDYELVIGGLSGIDRT